MSLASPLQHLVAQGPLQHMPNSLPAACNPLLPAANTADASSKHYRDLGQCTVVNEAHNQAAVLPLMHIPPSVVSRVLYTGKSVEGGITASAVIAGTMHCCMLVHAPITCSVAKGCRGFYNTLVTLPCAGLWCRGAC